MLKKLVAKYGAVITGVVAKGAFYSYKGGIFQGPKILSIIHISPKLLTAKLFGLVSLLKKFQDALSISSQIMQLLLWAME